MILKRYQWRNETLTLTRGKNRTTGKKRYRVTYHFKDELAMWSEWMEDPMQALKSFQTDLRYYDPQMRWTAIKDLTIR